MKCRKAAILKNGSVPEQCPRCRTVTGGQWRVYAGHKNGSACDAALTELTLMEAGFRTVGQLREACEALGVPLVFALGFVADGNARRTRTLAWARIEYLELARMYGGATPRVACEMRSAVSLGEQAASRLAALLALDGTGKKPR